MNPAPSQFRVDFIGEAVGQLDDLTARAEQLGLRDALALAYRLIIGTLKTRPREWGDPFRNYRGLNTTAYQHAVTPAGICVVYAVHNVEPVVWIYQLVVLKGSPFA